MFLLSNNNKMIIVDLVLLARDLRINQGNFKEKI